MPAFAGRYEYDADTVLGRGLFGVVYRAHDRHLGRNVALKVLDRPGADLAAAIREAQALTAATSPHVLGVLNADVHQDVPYLVTDIAPRGSVADVLEEFGMDAGQVVHILSHVCTGLSTCHTRGLLHRDIKPSNLFLLDNNHACIGDFGAVARMDSAGRATAEGDSLIRPPETLRYGYMDSRSDIYQVGVAAYEMLTGDAPFTAEADIVEGRYVRVRDAAPHVPRAVARIVERSMTRDPTERFASADALQAALSSVRNVRPRWVRTRPPHYADQRFVTLPETDPRAIEVTVGLLAAGQCDIDVHYRLNGRHVANASRRVPQRKASVAFRAVFDFLDRST